MTMPTHSMSVRRWMTLFSAFAVLAVAFSFSLFCWPALYRPLTRVHGWSFANADAGGSIVLFLIGILSPVVGILVDRFRPKRVILAGIVLSGLALALLSRAQTLPHYYACCALLGMGVSGVSILPTSILIGPFFSRRRGLAVGFINAGIGLGGFLAPRVVTAQIAQRGIPGTFMMLAACLAIPFLLMLPAADNAAVQPGSSAPAGVPAPGELVRMRRFWIIGAALFLGAHAMLGVQQNLMSYLTGARLPAAQAALLLAVTMASTAPGKLASGWIADWADARAALIASLASLAAGVVLLLGTAPQSAAMYGVAAVFGMGYGGIFNAPPSLVFEAFGTRRVGSVFGLVYVFFGMGTASGGLFAGYLFDRTRSWPVSFSVDLGLACAALLLTLASPGRLKQGQGLRQPAATPAFVA